MACKRADYQDVRSQMQPGDVIAFGGKGRFSEIIKWATRGSVSHVGVVLQSKLWYDNTPQKGFFNQIIESTTLEGFSGVSISRLSDRVNYYDGEIWWLPLSEAARSKLSLRRFFDFCLHQKGKRYDAPQAVKSALDALDKAPLIGGLTYNVEDFSRFFCSELVAAALEKAGVIRSVNASEITPIDLCMFSLYTRDYHQLKGARKAIRGYNSMDPTGFGQ